MFLQECETKWLAGAFFDKSVNLKGLQRLEVRSWRLDIVTGELGEGMGGLGPFARLDQALGKQVSVVGSQCTSSIFSGTFYHHS